MEEKMKFINLAIEGGIATVTLNRGKVNAINDDVVDEIKACFKEFENNDEVKAVIITGQGKFFSFGFDIPQFLSYSKEAFSNYIKNFTSLYTYLFLYPKPVIAAINGHAVAGGCMLANSCDYRLMVTGKAKIALNEVAFGSTIFAGSVEILKFSAGQRNAEIIAGIGKMFSAEEALKLGLIDQITAENELMELSRQIAGTYAGKSGPAYAHIKSLLRQPVVDSFQTREDKSIADFIEIWYSDTTWKNLEQIKIHN